MGGVISRVTIAITCIRGLITPLIATPEPPRKNERYRRNNSDNASSIGKPHYFDDND